MYDALGRSAYGVSEDSGTASHRENKILVEWPNARQTVFGGSGPSSGCQRSGSRNGKYLITDCGERSTTGHGFLAVTESCSAVGCDCIAAGGGVDGARRVQRFAGMRGSVWLIVVRDQQMRGEAATC